MMICDVVCVSEVVHYESKSNRIDDGLISKVSEQGSVLVRG